MSQPQQTLGGEIAVVLGAGLSSDGTAASERTAERARAALKLARERPHLTVILSGNGRKSNMSAEAKSEAWHMAALLEAGGISRSRLILEEDSIDTAGNAVLVAARFLHGQSPRPLFLVTSPFHVERALLMFRGVLGPTWPISAVTCNVLASEVERPAMELGGVAWTKRFFRGVQPGNLPQVVRRLLRVGKPQYRSFEVLNRLARRRSRSYKSPQISE